MALNISLLIKVLCACLLYIIFPGNITGQSATPGNPLMADPTILFHKDLYYLYGTGGGNHDDGFKVFTSKDRIHWRDGGYVLRKGEAFGTKGFWAPQVFEYNKKFYMAYTANEQIAIASAETPMGPFRQKNLAPLSSKVRMIDPFILIENNHVYLYHVRLENGNRIFVADLNKDLTAVDESSLSECIHAEPGWEDTRNAEWKVAEGPTVVRRGKWYYLFYSANDFRNPDYAVGYATAVSPRGPWEKNPANPIISEKLIGVPGTGHGDVFSLGNGHIGYVFHTHFKAEKVSPRKTAVVELTFKKQKSDPDEVKIRPGTFYYLQLESGSK
jgi:beta-xylosidase